MDIIKNQKNKWSSLSNREYACFLFLQFCEGWRSSTSKRRGIPAAAFVEDVQTFLTSTGSNATSALNTLQERCQQYKLVEMKLLAERDLQAKIPDMKKCLETMEALLAKQDIGEETFADFEVAGEIYS